MKTLGRTLIARYKIPAVITRPRKITTRSLKNAVSLPFLLAFTKLIIKNDIAKSDAVSINI